MRRFLRVTVFLGMLVLSVFLFAVIGEIASILGWILLDSLIPALPFTGWVVYAVGVALAGSAPLVAAARRRRTGVLSPLGVVVLAGFAAGFCPRLIIDGVADWSPLPLLIGFAVCAASAASCIAMLRPTEAETL